MLLKIKKGVFNLEPDHLVNTPVKEYDSKVAVVIVSTFLKHQQQIKDYPFLITRNADQSLRNT
ncbi:MAG: hypothetical protein U0X71_05270 [Sphingobacteriaceae bacterium]|nr:MAG: hypothetical protein E6Q66_05185 [Pedobacter sp.]